MRGTSSQVDFASETNALFTALLSGSLHLSHKLVTTFYILLCRLGKREFVAMMLKEALLLSPKTRIGHDSSYATKAAELGGSIVGLCGPEVVAEFLTQNLPLIVPVLSTELQAQLVARFTWFACALSQIFNLDDETVQNYYSHLVKASRKHCLLFFTELLERQCIAPSPIISLPVTFFSIIASNGQYILKFGSVERIAEALRKLQCTCLCAGLFDFTSENELQRAFKFYNNLTEK